MTRRDFVAIAQAIRENVADRRQREAVATALLPALRASNPRFDTGRFMAAVLG